MSDSNSDLPVPTKEEREEFRARFACLAYPESTVGIRLLAALEHLEAERGALWTIISEIREPIKRCFVDRVMPFAEFHDIASKWCESVTGENHPDTLRTQRDALAAFKTYVHARLDQEGIPQGDPNNQHQQEGCRIGARLDLVFERLKVVRGGPACPKCGFRIVESVRGPFVIDDEVNILDIGRRDADDDGDNRNRGNEVEGD